MSTPNSSEKKALSSPQNLWHLAIVALISSILFIGIAMADEWEVFAPIFSPSIEIQKATPKLESCNDAINHVLVFNEKLSKAYALKDVNTLPYPMIAPEIALSLKADMEFSLQAHQPLLRFVSQNIIEDGGRSGDLVIEEVWEEVREEVREEGQDESVKKHKLRYSYQVRQSPQGLLIKTIKPLLPEPKLARHP